MKEYLKLTLVVCVADDLRIKNLLKSIDVFCEVIVVLNGATKDVEEVVNSFRQEGNFELKTINIPERNLSKSRNYGIENAKYEKVVFYDSDCIIIPGALKKFYELLDEYLIVDGKVFFKKDTFVSKIISYTREQGIPGYALCPAIGINKKIKPQIGNYFFDDDIQWIEDSELNIRARKSDIKVGLIEEITCVHDNLTFKQDLKSAYRYGYGVKRAAKKNLHKKSPTANWNLIFPIMKINFISSLYYILWNIVYCIGYYVERPI